MAALSSRRTSWRLPPIRSDRVSRADAAGSLAEAERKLFMTCYRPCVMACVWAAVMAGLAFAQEEGGTGPLGPGGAVTSYQMKPVTGDVENTDQQRLNADAAQDNWRLHGHTKDKQRNTPQTQIDASNVKKLKPVALIQPGMANAMEATPLEIDGELFVETASNLVQAYDAMPGEQLRSYAPAHEYS